MRIGIDFDNTIVSYDALFHKVAHEHSTLPADIPVNKLAVRDYFRRVGQEDVWTELQGHVYGARMEEAALFDGVIDFLRRANAVGHELFIVSHKTRRPFVGPDYDLHAAAEAWIERHLVVDDNALLRRENVYFELTKPEKIARIVQCDCDAFIDDLPEILLAPGFPAKTARWLFDPEQQYRDASSLGLRSFCGWESLDVHFNCQKSLIK